MIEVIIEHWDNLAVAFAGVLAFFGGRKSKKIKENTEEAGALTSMQNAYNEFVIDQKDFVMEQRRQNAETNLKFYKGEEVLKSVREELKSVKEELTDWKSKYNNLKKQYNTLKNQFEMHKKKHN